MSKSLGNFFTVRDLLDQGIPGEVIRFVLLSTHYRQPMDLTEAEGRDAKRSADALREAGATRCSMAGASDRRDASDAGAGDRWLRSPTI